MAQYQIRFRWWISVLGFWFRCLSGARALCHAGAGASGRGVVRGFWASNGCSAMTVTLLFGRLGARRLSIVGELWQVSMRKCGAGAGCGSWLWTHRL